MNQGTLFYNYASGRMDILFSNGQCYGGLHCGTTFEILVEKEWRPTRIEMSDDWYLVGVNISKLEGLKVQI